MCTYCNELQNYRRIRVPTATFLPNYCYEPTHQPTTPQLSSKRETRWRNPGHVRRMGWDGFIVLSNWQFGIRHHKIYVNRAPLCTYYSCLSLLPGVLACLPSFLPLIIKAHPEPTYTGWDDDERSGCRATGKCRTERECSAASTFSVSITNAPEVCSWGGVWMMFDRSVVDP